MRLDLAKISFGNSVGIGIEQEIRHPGQEPSHILNASIPDLCFI
jgi:hypothetical protein